jgi:hypothetical protein
VGPLGNGYIDESDLELMHVVGDPVDACHIIEAAYQLQLAEAPSIRRRE